MTYPDPGSFWRALPPPDSGRIVDRRGGRFRRPLCLVCSRSCGGERGPLQRVLGRGPVTDNNQLCVRCFARFTPEFGVATTEVSLVMMAIGMFGRRPTRMDEERFADFAVRSMRAHGGTADRHGGVIDQLPDTGNLVALWIPRMAGLHHARRAIEAGQDLSRTIGRDKYLAAGCQAEWSSTPRRGLSAWSVPLVQHSNFTPQTTPRCWRQPLLTGPPPASS